MLRNEVKNEYFEWLFDLVCENRYGGNISYRNLLSVLFNTTFRWIIEKDENRAYDGIELRYRFSLAQGYEDNYFEEDLEGPCSVLEMMIALAIRCEEDIMDDPSFGDRTDQWFWNMINSLGLGDMTDSRFDEDYVYDVIERFLDREYEPNGKGSLFTIKGSYMEGCYDLRDIEIWYQLNWYLDSIGY